MPRSFGVPMDVWWFRLSRRPDDPSGGVGRFSRGHFCVMIDRGDYWQCGYLISKGTDAALRAAGIEELQRRFAGLLPWMADRVGELTSWDDVHLLNVRLERLRRWDLDGLLLIGDAAHAMSPVGGVGHQPGGGRRGGRGAAAGPGAASGAGSSRAAAGPGAAAALVADRADPGRAAAGAPRRSSGGCWPTRPPGWPRRPSTAAPTGAGGLDGTADVPTAPLDTLPLPLRLLRRFPVLQGIPARLVAIGPLPEHAPDWARRTPSNPVHARASLGDPRRTALFGS